MRPLILFDELVMEILSWLPVKSLLRFTCVCKSFQSLISDSSFVKLHLHRSPKNANFLVEYCPFSLARSFVLPCPARSLLENPLSHIAHDSLGFGLNNKYQVHGSCNGLVCFIAEFNTGSLEGCTFCLWNPATRKTFENPQCVLVLPENYYPVMFGFGCDNLSDTYKVVAVLTTSEDDTLKSCDVKICSIGDNNGWRNIQSFPADPNTMEGDGVYLNSTLNWLASTHYTDDLDITFDELVIVSLDLVNETYTLLLLPRGLDGVHTNDFRYIENELHSNESPSFGVFKDCLSLFLHNKKTNRFIVWQMKEFGDQKSWTLLLNIAIQDLLQIDCRPRGELVPLCMFEKGRVLMIHDTYDQMQAIFYDGRNNTVKHSEIFTNILCVYAKDYVQSLVSPRGY
ncbi:F-box/kelch-repeat protein [Spatholobus suberectus]|nr:F-box/kelch-repeat protein [Spatholobus suberectus]